VPDQGGASLVKPAKSDRTRLVGRKGVLKHIPGKKWGGALTRPVDILLEKNKSGDIEQHFCDCGCYWLSENFP